MVNSTQIDWNQIEMIAHDVLELIFQRKNLSKILNTFYVQKRL